MAAGRADRFGAGDPLPLPELGRDARLARGAAELRPDVGLRAARLADPAARADRNEAFDRPGAPARRGDRRRGDRARRLGRSGGGPGLFGRPQADVRDRARHRRGERQILLVGPQRRRGAAPALPRAGEMALGQAALFRAEALARRCVARTEAARAFGRPPRNCRQWQAADYHIAPALQRRGAAVAGRARGFEDPRGGHRRLRPADRLDGREREICPLLHRPLLRRNGGADRHRQPEAGRVPAGRHPHRPAARRAAVDRRPARVRPAPICAEPDDCLRPRETLTESGSFCYSHRTCRPERK